jgi:xanthine/uracil permease
MRLMDLAHDHHVRIIIGIVTGLTVMRPADQTAFAPMARQNVMAVPSPISSDW